jgi:hypothetical protein
VKSGKDPLMRLLNDLGAGANDLGGKLRDRFTGGGSKSAPGGTGPEGDAGGEGGPEPGPATA